MKPVLIALTLAAAAAHAAKLPVQVLDRNGTPVADAVVVLTPARSSVLPRLMPRGSRHCAGENAVRTRSHISSRCRRTHIRQQRQVGAPLRGTAAGALQFASAGESRFELRLDVRADGKPGKAADVVVTKAGAILLGCHLHRSMRGLVSDSPWALKTGEDGLTVSLPDGEGRVGVWQADQPVDLPVLSTNAGRQPRSWRSACRLRHAAGERRVRHCEGEQPVRPGRPAAIDGTEIAQLEL